MTDRATMSTQTWDARLARLIGEAPVNLVSARDRAVVRDLHIAECREIAQHVPCRSSQRWMDLGTGGGLPGLVLAHAFPDVEWILVDARRKKVDLVAAFANVLSLANVLALHARAEDLGAERDHVGSYAGVVSRAVGSLSVTAVLARPFITSGEIVAIRGPKAEREAADAERFLQSIHCSVVAVERIEGTMRPTYVVRLRGTRTRWAAGRPAYRAALAAARGEQT